MAALRIQLPHVQLLGTSSVRPPTPVLQPSGLQSQSQPQLQLLAQSQPFLTPQHQISHGAISSGFEQVPQFTPLHSGFTPQSASASKLVFDSSIGQDISFSYSALTGQPTPSPLQAPVAFTLPVTTTEPVIVSGLVRAASTVLYRSRDVSYNHSQCQPLQPDLSHQHRL